MTNQIDHIVEHFFQKKRLDDVSVYELERFIATHPYFAAGHFLMAKKTQLDQSDDIYEKISATALYYNNPLWLQWLLEQDLSSSAAKEIDRVDTVQTDTEENDEDGIDTVVSTDNEDTELEFNAEPVSEENGSGSFTVEETPVDNEFSSSPEVVTNTFHDDDHKVHAQSQHGWNGNPQQLTEAEQSADAVEHPEVAEQLIEAQTIPERIDNDTEISESFPSPESMHVEESPMPGESPDTVNVEPEENPLPEEIVVPDIAAEISDEKEPEETVSDIADEEARATAAGIERSLSTATLIPTKAEIEKNELTFEPYHTIDYFASQGIKLQQSDLSKDKFGKQLKSFTDWLRSMKRLPQAAVETNMDEATQQSIQQIAEHSFEEKDIVTETMAEVWIKQGNKEKAIDTLQKLSLLNPSKSHYFAAKIEQLNAS